MKLTPSGQDLMAAAVRHTVNRASILARLIAAIGDDPDAEATGEEVAEALPSRVTPRDTRRLLPRDPEVAT